MLKKDTVCCFALKDRAGPTSGLNPPLRSCGRNKIHSFTRTIALLITSTSKDTNPSRAKLAAAIIG